MRIILILTLFIFNLSFATVIFNSEKKEYKENENICFYLKNNSNNIIFLPSSAPWAVFEDEKFEKIIYSPISSQVIVKLNPNQEKKWCWKQENFKNKKVSAGEYTIRITYFENGKRKFATFKVKIVSDYSDAK